MLEGLVLVVILLAGLVLGGLLLRLWPADGRHIQADWLEWGFASLTIGLLLIGWTAVVLAEFGWFSISLLAALWFIVVIFLFVRARQKNRALTQLTSSPRSQAKWERPLLLLWFILAVWLFFRPHQLITGAGDAGVYVNLSANIHRTGSILIQDSGLAELERSLQETFLRDVRNPEADSYLLPAYFVTDAAVGEIMPQFYPLHPVWYAIGYALGGLQTTLMMTGLWALLASLAIYLFMRQIGRWPFAFLALVVLSLNGMQVWFARYPTSEALTQFLLWAGLWATAVWLSNRPQAKMWALLAGASLGNVFLVRIDVLFIVPVLALVVVWQWRRRQPGVFWFAVPLVVLIVHSLIHALWQSRPYFFDLYNYAVLSLLRGQTGLIVVVGVGVAGLALFAYFFKPIMQLLNRYRRPFLSVIILALAGLAIYAWFIRPYSADIIAYNDQFSGTSLTKYDHENLLRLGWYLSPIGVWLGVLGICWLVWRVNWQTAVMLLITLFFTVFYIWEIRNNPTQIYAMRRYVPAVLPLFTIAGGYFIDHCQLKINNHRLKHIVPVALAVLWLGSTAWSARGFVSQVDYAGLPEQIEQFANGLDSESVILWNYQQPISVGDQLGTPLKFQHEHDIYILRNLDALDDAALVRMIEKWQNTGRSIYWAGDPAWLEAQQISFTANTVEFKSNYLEHSFDHKPTAVVPLHWVVELAKLEE